MVCRGIRPGDLVKVVLQANLGVTIVKNGLHKGGQFCVFCRCDISNGNLYKLPSGMARRWMNMGEHWDSARSEHHALTLSSAQVVRVLFPSRPRH